MQMFKNYKSIINFSVLKFIALGLSSFSMIVLAKKIGPYQMGLAMPIFLYITYSNYLSLGVNQVMTKNYSRTKGNSNILKFLTINLQIILFAFILNLFISYFIFSKQFFYISAISSIIMLRGYFSSYFRVINKK